MSSAITITTAAGRAAEFTTAQGMMAGQIAEKFNKELGHFGLDAITSNKLEIYGLPNGRLQFDMIGNNSTASAIDVTISNNDTTALVTEINSKS